MWIIYFFARKNRQNTDINTQDYDISHLNLGDPFLERTHNYEHGATHTLQLDYALPVHKNLILETGYKGLFRSLNADFETANLEKRQLYHTNRVEQYF
ncbi:MAG: outer membrane beta-barrel protein [Saprospiraceae bacterium]|nr:outer membrane beta-barrel protein [Saprospiraceae bacterium]